MKRLFIGVTCLALILAPSGLAQRKARKKAPAKTAAPTVPADKWPIATLAVDGNQVYPTREILAIAGLKIGQLAGKEEFDAARDRLLASGAFETVGYKFAAAANGKQYAATFQVTEVQALPVRFEDLGAPDADLEAMLRARDPLFSIDRVPASKPVMERYRRWISEYLASKGLDSKIDGSVTPWPEKMAIVFRPLKRLPAVAQVTFEGNQSVPQDVLRRAIAGAAIGAPYREDRFREILESSIRPVYEARGRVRVAFPKVRTEPAKDVEGLHVFVTVSEGEIFKLGRVEVVPPTPLRPAELLKTGDFKTNDVANFDRVKEGLENIRKAVRRAGYLDVNVTTDRNIHDAEKTVDLAVRVDAGPQYAMGKLNIVGLDLDGEAEMRRIWGLKEGKTFDPEYPDVFLTTARGMFDNLGETKAETKVDEEKRTVDVTLRFAGSAPSTTRKKQL